MTPRSHPRQHGRPPKPVIAVVVLLLVGLASFWWWHSRPTTGDGPMVASGSVEAKEYQVAAALAGVEALGARHRRDAGEGRAAPGRAGRSGLALQLTQAQEGVKAAQASLTNARDDGTTADVAAAAARVKQAEAAVSLAKVAQGYATVTAPHAGLVSSVTTNAGQNAAPGKTLITLTDPADLFVRVYVPETEIGTVKIGQKASASIDGSAARYFGSVSFCRRAGRVHPQHDPNPGPAHQARLPGPGPGQRRLGNAQAGPAGGCDVRMTPASPTVPTAVSAAGADPADRSARGAGPGPDPPLRRPHRGRRAGPRHHAGRDLRPARPGRGGQVDPDSDARDRLCPGRRRRAGVRRLGAHRCRPGHPADRVHAATVLPLPRPHRGREHRLLRHHPRGRAGAAAGAGLRAARLDGVGQLRGPPGPVPVWRDEQSSCSRSH